MIARVYWNSRRKCWSVVDGASLRVVFSPLAVLLHDVSFIVSEAGHARSMQIGRKTVHAWAGGKLVCMSSAGVSEPLIFSDDIAEAFRAVRYDRRDGPFFTSGGKTVTRATVAYFAWDGNCRATGLTFAAPSPSPEPSTPRPLET